MGDYVIQTVAMFEKYYYIKAESREEAEEYLKKVWMKREKGGQDLTYYLGPQIEDDIIFSVAPCNGKKPDLKLIYNGSDNEVYNKFHETIQSR